MKGKINLFKRRSFGDILNDTLGFFTQNFKELITAILFIAGPFMLAAGVLSGAYVNSIFGYMDSSNPFDMLNQVFSLNYFLMLLCSMLGATFLLASVYAYMLLYEEKAEGETITVLEVWQEVKKHVVKLFLYMLLLWIILSFATLFFIIPGIYLAITLSLLLFISVREEMNFGQAWKRSSDLIKDNWWQTFAILLVIYIIVAIISSIFSVPLFATRLISGFEADSVSSPLWMTIMSGIIQLLSTILNAILIIATGIIYYSYLEEKESVSDLNQLDELDSL